MIPASIRRRLVCAECVRLFVYLDETQRDRCAPVQGLEKVEDAMSWQTRTAKRHLLHLAEVGLVELRPEPKPHGGWSHIRFAVRHNPARSRYASLRTVPGVWETPRRRYKNAPGLDRLNACRDAPSVTSTGEPDTAGDYDREGPSNAWRDAPSGERDAPSVVQHDACRDAPSVTPAPSLLSDSPTREPRDAPASEGGDEASSEAVETRTVRDVFADLGYVAEKTQLPEPPPGGEEAPIGAGLPNPSETYAHDQPDHDTRSRLTPRDAAPIDNDETSTTGLLGAFPDAVEVDPTSGLTPEETNGYEAITEWNHHAYRRPNP